VVGRAVGPAVGVAVGETDGAAVGVDVGHAVHRPHVPGHRRYPVTFSIPLSTALSQSKVGLNVDGSHTML
jgi:hypothetical protein